MIHVGARGSARAVPSRGRCLSGRAAEALHHRVVRSDHHRGVVRRAAWRDAAGAHRREAARAVAEQADGQRRAEGPGRGRVDDPQGQARRAHDGRRAGGWRSWIEVATRAQGRLLLRSVGLALAWEASAPAVLANAKALAMEASLVNRGEKEAYDALNAALERARSPGQVGARVGDRDERSRRDPVPAGGHARRRAHDRRRGHASPRRGCSVGPVRRVPGDRGHGRAASRASAAGL